MFSDLNRRDLYKTYQYAVCQGKAKANWLSNAKKEKKCCLCFLSSHVFMFTKKKRKCQRNPQKGHCAVRLGRPIILSIIWSLAC